jgi:hypothetical protein
VEPTPRHVQRIAISLLTAGGLMVGGFVAAAPTADTGIGVRALMRRVGQPWQRLGRELTYCAKEPGRKRVLMSVELSRAGKVTGVGRG